MKISSKFLKYAMFTEIVFILVLCYEITLALLMEGEIKNNAINTISRRIRSEVEENDCTKIECRPISQSNPQEDENTALQILMDFYSSKEPIMMPNEMKSKEHEDFILNKFYGITREPDKIIKETILKTPYLGHSGLQQGKIKDKVPQKQKEFSTVPIKKQATSVTVHHSNKPETVVRTTEKSKFVNRLNENQDDGPPEEGPGDVPEEEPVPNPEEPKPEVTTAKPIAPLPGEPIPPAETTTSPKPVGSPAANPTQIPNVPHPEINITKPTDAANPLDPKPTVSSSNNGTDGQAKPQSTVTSVGSTTKIGPETPVDGGKKTTQPKVKPSEATPKVPRIPKPSGPKRPITVPPGKHTTKHKKKEPGATITSPSHVTEESATQNPQQTEGDEFNKIQLIGFKWSQLGVYCTFTGFMAIIALSKSSKLTQKNAIINHKYRKLKNLMHES
jgi:hypothetical protein